MRDGPLVYLCPVCIAVKTFYLILTFTLDEVPLPFWGTEEDVIVMEYCTGQISTGPLVLLLHRPREVFSF